MDMHDTTEAAIDHDTVVTNEAPENSVAAETELPLEQRFFAAREEHDRLYAALSKRMDTFGDNDTESFQRIYSAAISIYDECRNRCALLAVEYVKAHPDGELMMQYLRAGLALAIFRNQCDQFGEHVWLSGPLSANGDMTPTQIAQQLELGVGAPRLRSSAIVAGLKNLEIQVSHRGYRTFPLDLFKQGMAQRHGVRWTVTSQLFVRRDEGEKPVLHTFELCKQHPSLTLGVKARRRK
jgi:hypothetical protein